MGKEIQSYCARLVEVHEEELTAAVRAEGFNSTATEGLLCRRLTNACKNQARAQAGQCANGCHEADAMLWQCAEAAEAGAARGRGGRGGTGGR